jgi:alpha-D-xyloside xylohydrolase
MDWSNIELRLFTADSSVAEGSVCLPSDNRLHHLKIKQQQDKWLLTENPLKGQVTFKITHK